MYFLNLFVSFLHTCYIYVCYQLVALVREHVWHKVFLRCSLRLELTLVSSISDPWLVKLVYIGVVVPVDTKRGFRNLMIGRFEGSEIDK